MCGLVQDPRVLYVLLGNDIVVVEAGIRLIKHLVSVLTLDVLEEAVSCAQRLELTMHDLEGV